MRRPRLELHIERLVLTGLAGLDAESVGRALGAELERLLAEGGPPFAAAGLDGRALLDGGAFPLAPHPDPGTVGGQLARSLYAGLHP